MEEQPPNFRRDVVRHSNVKIESRHVAPTHVLFAYKLRHATIADKRAHVGVKPITREPHNHWNPNAGDPATPQNTGKIQEPEFVADLDKVWLLFGEDATQGAFVSPCVEMRQHPAIARIDDR